MQSRNAVRVTALLGGGVTRIDDAAESVYVIDHSFMEGGEYAEFNANPYQFYFSKIFRRYAKPELTMAELKVAIREWSLWRAGNTARNQMLVDEYGCLLYFRTFPDCPLESLFGRNRGIKGLSIDLRKRKDEVKEYCDRYFETITKPMLRSALEGGKGGYTANMGADWRPRGMPLR